ERQIADPLVRDELLEELPVGIEKPPPDTAGGLLVLVLYLLKELVFHDKSRLRCGRARLRTARRSARNRSSSAQCRSGEAGRCGRPGCRAAPSSGRSSRACGRWRRSP